MVTLTILTLRLAEAIGLALILMGLSGLSAPQRWRLLMDELSTSPALQMTLGITVFAIGVTLAMVHSILSDPLAIIVTVIGWAALIKGALLIAVHGPILRLGFWSLAFTRIWAIVALILGFFLALAGLTGTAGYPNIV